ncbi:MAG: PQQ-binding-like beta-propeller repeat protein [Bryobacteraceae bacterium]
MKKLLMFLWVAMLTPAENWPQFRGPGGQGHSSEKGLPFEWSESSGVRWRTAVPGKGWSSPAIQGKHIWLTTATEEGYSLRLIGLDRDSGRILKNVEVFRLNGKIPIHTKNSQASPTPILDGDRIFVHFGSHGTACVRTSGETVWKTRLEYYHRHGPGGSPALYKDLLVLSCDGYDIQYMVALDKSTGRIRWKKSRTGYQAYTTPLVIRVDGRDQLVSPGAHRAVAYEPREGNEIWSVRYGKGYSNVPRPLFGHGLVFICSGFDQPYLLAVKPDGRGDVTSSHVAWTVKRGAPLTPSPLLVGDELYFISDTGVATCVDARTGREHWRERLGGNYSASPVYADGRIYFASEECEFPVVAAGKTFRLLARNRLEGRCLASMAVSGGGLFIRSDSHLYKIGGSPAGR